MTMRADDDGEGMEGVESSDQIVGNMFTKSTLSRPTREDRRLPRCSVELFAKKGGGDKGGVKHTLMNVKASSSSSKAIGGSVSVRRDSDKRSIVLPSQKKMEKRMMKKGCPSGMVLDGIPTDTTDYEYSEAAIAPLGCSSSAAAFVPSGSSYMVSGTGWGEAAERKMGAVLCQLCDFFHNCGSQWMFCCQLGALDRGMFLQGKRGVSGVKKGSYHTAWSVPCDSSCTCSYAYGQGPAIGPHTGERCWPLLAGLWTANAPLMRPWCAEGEVPTAANLNLYRGWKSCVGWHCDDEPLFGKCGDAKLIVSVSLGNFAVFRWIRQSCATDEGHSCRLGHGDILVMVGQCQDEFLHRTGLGREQERTNVTFRWIKQHVSSCPLFKAEGACCLPTCAQGSSVPVMGNVVFFWFLLGVLCILGVLALQVSPFFCVQGFGHIGVPPALHALWAEVGGGIPFVTLGERLAAHKNCQKLLLDWRKFHRGKAIYASRSGTTQSLWL